MAKVRAKRLRTRAALTGWRLALVYLALAAFALQTYVVQTHIHFAPAEAARLSGDAHSSAASGHHDKFPASDDPANCPICQEILHSGQYVTPAAQFLLPPTLAISTIAVVDQALPHIFAPSHSWRGRAPPRH